MGLISKYQNIIASFIGFLFLIPLGYVLINITQESSITSKNIVTKNMEENEESTFFGTPKTVIIDAGHGGEDGGAVGADGVTVEKNLNLDVALKVAKLLKKNKVQVVLTRTKDESLHSEEAKSVREKKVSDIHNRFSIMCNLQNPIFVSIHMNKYENPSCRGAQTFYSPNNDASKELSEFIQKSIISNIQKDNTRLVKKSGSNIFLLYHAQVPAVLVECGFMSCPEELELLKSAEYRDKMADAISKGIMEYINTRGKN